MKTVDLSLPLFHGAPSYPTDPDIAICREKYIHRDNSLLHSIRFGTHSGTHLDVPAHIINGGKTLSDYTLESFFGVGIVVDYSNYLKLNDHVDGTDAVIFNTGWYKKIDDQKTYFGKDRLEIPEELIELIVKNNIRIFGCDLPSVDASGSKGKPIHKVLLQRNVIIYESLTNLDEVPMLKPFQFFGFPLSFNNLDGSPVRAVALLD